MKKIILLIPTLLMVLSIWAQPPEGPANSGMNFGVSTNTDGALNVDELPAILSGKSSAEVKVKGKVMDVCKAEGCWLKMETANGPIMIKMKDHAFMVPLAMNGKTIVAQGTANFKETSVEMQRHYAEDAGKSKKEIAAIRKPKKEITIQATGILVL